MKHREKYTHNNHGRTTTNNEQRKHRGIYTRVGNKLTRQSREQSTLINRENYNHGTRDRK